MTNTINRHGSIESIQTPEGYCIRCNGDGAIWTNADTMADGIVIDGHFYEEVNPDEIHVDSDNIVYRYQF